MILSNAEFHSNQITLDLSFLSWIIFFHNRKTRSELEKENRSYEKYCREMIIKHTDTCQIISANASITTVTNSMLLCFVWHIRPLHLLWIHCWDHNDIFMLAPVCTICLLNRVKADRSSKLNRKERGAYHIIMIEKTLNAIYHLNVCNGLIHMIFMRHSVCSELMNLQEEHASVSRFFFFFYHHVQCPDLISV